MKNLVIKKRKQKLALKLLKIQQMKVLQKKLREMKAH